MVSVKTAQLCCCSRKAAIDNMQRDGHGYILIKLLYLSNGGLDLACRFASPSKMVTFENC